MASRSQSRKNRLINLSTHGYRRFFRWLTTPEVLLALVDVGLDDLPDRHSTLPNGLYHNYISGKRYR